MCCWLFVQQAFALQPAAAYMAMHVSPATCPALAWGLYCGQSRRQAQPFAHTVLLQSQISCIVSVAQSVVSAISMSWAAASDSVHARPGVMELIDEARAAGLKLAVCSAATKTSVKFCIENLLGRQRYEVCQLQAKPGSALACL